MRLTACGYGAGGRELPIPNVLRLLIGEAASPGSATLETLVLLETNVDDMNPELYDFVMGRLFEAGALDVFLSNIQMKKNRPATQVHVLGRPEQTSALTEILFAETSTLGVRQQLVNRQALPRKMKTVQTPYGEVRVKFAEWQEGRLKYAPEYEDCRRLAAKNHVPIREVYRAVEIACSKNEGERDRE
jgi:hypothetical protein